MPIHISIRPIAPLSTKLNSSNYTRTSNAIPHCHTLFRPNHHLLTSLKLESPPSLFADTLDWLSQCSNTPSLAHFKGLHLWPTTAAIYAANSSDPDMVFLNYLSTTTGRQHPVAYRSQKIDTHGSTLPTAQMRKCWLSFGEWHHYFEGSTHPIRLV